MAIVFCNIGWMNHYDGNHGDPIKRGGSYNKNEVGHEVCNFTCCDGKVYGYVQPTGRIAVERLGASKSSDLADGVTVVWTAGPDDGGTAIIGWYTNATVFRDLKKIPKPTQKHQLNNLSEYRIVALAENAYLISSTERYFKIPRAKKGGIGQSNVWYADKSESADLVSDVVNLIQSVARISRLPDVDAQFSAFEVNLRLVAHLRRERNSSLISKKKDSVLAATGKLCCEACGFDFKEKYGKYGDGFCEVHHLKPIHEMGQGGTTEMTDLSIVCSNCHRIIHQFTEMPTLEDFRMRIAEETSA